MDEMFTMRPQRARIMPLMMAARVVAKAENRSVRMRSSQSGGDIWISSLSRTAPALLTSTSTLPMALTIASTCAGSPTSAGCAVALGNEAAVSCGAELDHRAHPHRAHRNHRARPVDLAQHLLAQLFLQRGHSTQGLA